MDLRSFTKKKKRTATKKVATGFTIMLIPDSSDVPKSAEISFDRLVRWVSAAIAVAIIMIGLFASTLVHNHALKKALAESERSIHEIEDVNVKLGQTIDALNGQLKSNQETFDKIQATINEQKEELTDAMVNAAIPDSIPVKGAAAVIVNDPNIEDGEAASNGIVLSTTAGAVVVASGSGTVESVSDDVFYSKKIVIDHGNGYKSTYRIQGDTSVKSGANVAKNDMLCVMTQDGMVSFEVSEDGVYIDPKVLLAN